MNKLLKALLGGFTYACGMIVALYGIGYFCLIDPHTNWPLMFQQIVPEKQWIVALSLFISGMITAMFPFYLFYFRDSHK